MFTADVSPPSLIHMKTGGWREESGSLIRIKQADFIDRSTSVPLLGNRCDMLRPRCRVFFFFTAVFLPLVTCPPSRACVRVRISPVSNPDFPHHSSRIDSGIWRGKMGEIRLPVQAFLWCMSTIYMFAFASLYVQIPGDSPLSPHNC